MPVTYKIFLWSYDNEAMRYRFKLYDEDDACVYASPRIYTSRIGAIGAATSKLRYWKP